MSMFSFIKEAGEKLFGHKEVEQAAATSAPNLDALNAQAAQAIKTYIEAQNLSIADLAVQYDAKVATATVQGEAPTQEDSEKAILSAGNVGGVGAVVNQLTVATPADEAQYHDVERGDTLSAIAKKFYGNANKYSAIFDANKPMLSSPDKIYPGQKLRIPPQA